jgi:hypothetical protein
MVDGVKILTMTNVVVFGRKVVVNRTLFTTTYFPIVERLTMRNCMWSLIINEGAFKDHGQPHFCGH